MDYHLQLVHDLSLHHALSKFVGLASSLMYKLAVKSNKIKKALAIRGYQIVWKPQGSKFLTY